MIRKIFIKIKKYALNKLLDISLKNKEKSFVFFYNIYCYFKNFKIRAQYINQRYYVVDNLKTWQVYPLERFRFYVNGLKYRSEQISKEYLLKNIKFDDNDIIIDCGANNGDLYLCFDKKIEYYGIEPSPIVFSNLQNNIKNQTLINKALWKNQQKEIDFYLLDSSGDSSIFEIENYTKKITIETITLDNLIDKINKRIKLVKLEAEGSEPEILEGLNKHLNLVEFITIDVGFERGLNQEQTLVPCLKYLTKLNFELIDFEARGRVTVLFKNKNI